jgi:hypothetical protein
MLCVYGIVRSAHPGVDARGVHGSRTRTIGCGDLAAIVSEVHGEMLARRRDVEAHLDVLERALAHGDVLPFRFGTVVDDEAAMRSVVEASAGHYTELLGRLGGRVQMTVKAVRDDDAAVATVVTGSDRLRRAAGRTRSSDDWSERVALGQQVSTAVEDLSSRDAQLILDRLAPLAEQVVVEPVRPPAIAFAALLMRPDRLAQLDTVVASLHDELGSRISFEYAGPMPAYSFVT